MWTLVKRLATDEKGPTMVEYGLMLVLIAAVCVVVVTIVGTKTKNAFDTLKNVMP